MKQEGATLEIIAPTVGGVEASDGTLIAGDQKIGGGPSVLYDAVAVLPSEDGVKRLLTNPAARDFVADAFAHLKFIAYVEAAMPLFEKAGIAADLDEGCITSHRTQALRGQRCSRVRRRLPEVYAMWEREKLLK